MTRVNSLPKRPLWKKRFRRAVVAIPPAVAATVLLIKNAEALTAKVRGWLDPGPGSAHVSYTRLFGAYQVPAIMFRMDWLPRGSLSSDTLDQSSVIGGLTDFRRTIARWDSTSLRDSKFVYGPVGTRIDRAFRQFQASPCSYTDPISTVVLFDDTLRLAYRYLEPDLCQMSDVDLATAQRMFPHEVGERGTIYPELKLRLQRASEQIGYLFLMVEDTSASEAMTDMKLEYSLYNLDAYGSPCTPSADRIKPVGTASTSARLALPPLRPGERLLIPLAVYRVDQDRFPKAFCSSVLAPHQLTWIQNGRARKRQIEAPSLDNSARVMLGFQLGWYHQ
jgi:hypothetical protein